MLKYVLLFITASGFVSNQFLQAGDPVPPQQTWLIAPQKVLLDNSFETTPAAPWKMLKGEYKTTNDGLLVKELVADKHGAVMRVPVNQADFVAQYSFKLAGGKSTTFSINDKAGHNSRVFVSKLGLQVRKDSHDHNNKDLPANLDKSAEPISENEWHTLQVEVNGGDILAVLDGKVMAFGEHESIKVEKSDIGLTVSGEGVYFKDFTVWTGTAKPDWTKVKAELRAKKPADTAPLSPPAAKKPAAKKT
jgi:hypothetical protein